MVQVNIKRLIDDVQCYQTVRELRGPARASVSREARQLSIGSGQVESAVRAFPERSYRIPGSWHVRMSYTEDISVPNP